MRWAMLESPVFIRSSQVGAAEILKPQVALFVAGYVLGAVVGSAFCPNSGWTRKLNVEFYTRRVIAEVHVLCSSGILLR